MAKRGRPLRGDRPLTSTERSKLRRQRLAEKAKPDINAPMRAEPKDPPGYAESVRSAFVERSPRAADKIAAGLVEAAAVASGEVAPAKVHVISVPLSGRRPTLPGSLLKKKP